MANRPGRPPRPPTHLPGPLQAAHATVGGTGPGRRWLTEELNHALIVRLAAEFQGFARDLHEEAAKAVAGSLAAGFPPREKALQDAFSHPAG